MLLAIAAIAAISGGISAAVVMSNPGARSAESLSTPQNITKAPTVSPTTERPTAAPTEFPTRLPTAPTTSSPTTAPTAQGSQGGCTDPDAICGCDLVQSQLVGKSQAEQGFLVCLVVIVDFGRYLVCCGRKWEYQLDEF